MTRCLHCYLGNIDSTTYEDTCREMFGVHAFVVFTIDRLVQNTVRQVGHVRWLLKLKVLFVDATVYRKCCLLMRLYTGSVIC